MFLWENKDWDFLFGDFANVTLQILILNYLSPSPENIFTDFFFFQSKRKGGSGWWGRKRKRRERGRETERQR